MPFRLKLPFIERKPKKVHKLKSFRVAVKLTDKQEEFLLDIVECIEQGRSLPRGSYRVSTREDILLLNDGIMHLHLGHPGSRELVYLVQYENHVVLLEVSDHYHFRTRPIGTTLKSFHASRMKQWAAENVGDPGKAPPTQDVESVRLKQPEPSGSKIPNRRFWYNYFKNRLSKR